MGRVLRITLAVTLAAGLIALVLVAKQAFAPRVQSQVCFDGIAPHSGCWLCPDEASPNTPEEYDRDCRRL